ncbi:hypothetical protein G6F56_000669 [Rhizopus delemar]|nr:hypothetical protein G6F56_000669 [Rhizopus delemar]
MNSPLADTVLAWSQNELFIYITLSLIQPLSELSNMDDKVVVCLAHRYFHLPQLIQNIQAPDHDQLASLFEEHAAIDIQQPDWIFLFKQWVQSSQEEEIDMEFEKKANGLLSQLLDIYHSSLQEHSIVSSKKEDSLEDTETAYQTVKHELGLLELKGTWQSAINAVQAVIEDHLENADRHQTTQTVAHVQNELEFIQAKMRKTTTTTDAGIQDLEQRAAKVGHLLGSIPDLDETLAQKYRLVCAWVEEVRVWFVEADRIRTWIEERIVVLEGKQPIEALEEVELEYAREQVGLLNREHERLQAEVQMFDEQDMTRLRAHVKALTGNNKDLSPADTTTIEITFTTLMTLDRLMHLLRRRSYELQILTLRMEWEQEYEGAVGWVRTRLEQCKAFIDNEARWRPVTDRDKQQLVDALVCFENERAQFDKTEFMATVNAYQELDDSCHMELPIHLESRQVALEEAFETLTNRIVLARQVVEQYLVITDFLERADELKSLGEQLRQEITQAENTQSTVDLSEKVNVFQEDAIRLITTVASRIPYPEASHPSDQQDNEDANETIRMVIGARKSALMLLSEALDQGLNAYRRALQHQKRVQRLQEEINRLNGWVDERMRAMQKAKVDVFVGKCALDEVDLARLRKERDGQVAKLKGIRENEVRKLSENVQSLPNMTTQHKSCIDTLQLGLDQLQQHLAKLDEALSSHSLGLTILEKRIAWEALYNKSLQSITNMTYNTWDFTAKKAQWRHSKQMSDWTQVEQDFKAIQAKMTHFEQHTFESEQRSFHVLVEGFDLIEKEDVPLTDHSTMTPEHVKRRQDTLNRSFVHLQDLLLYTQSVLDQHVHLEAFSTQASVLYASGESLLGDLEKMLEESSEEQVEDIITNYAHQVLEIWTRMGSRIPYPQCNEEARATRFSTADDEIGTEIANSVYKAYADLQDLVNQIKDLFVRLKKQFEYRRELDACVQETEALTACLKQTKQESEAVYDFDLLADTIQPADQPLDAQALAVKTEQLTQERYKPLLERIHALDMNGDEALDLSGLAQLKMAHKDLMDYVDFFASQAECYGTRLRWQSLLAANTDQLNRLQERVRNTVNEKNYWISLEQDELLEKLVKDASEHQQEINDFAMGAHETLETAFVGMMQAYDRLGQTPNSIKGKQAETKRRLKKMQDFIGQQVLDMEQIQARHCWETAVDRELKKCSDFETEISAYIHHHTRWSSEIPDREVFNKDSLSGLLVAFDGLKATENTHKRKAAIKATQLRMESAMAVFDQALDQTNMICRRLTEIDLLEERAERLKTEFLATDEGDFQEDYKLFEADIGQLDISFPLLADEPAYTSSVSEMLQKRQCRLQELVSTLASILKTKEQVSRRRAAEASYLADVDTVKEWMESKRTKTSQLDLRETFLAAEATHAAVLAYANTINALRASLVKTMQIMEQDSLKRVQEEVDAEYESLCEHVSQVKQDLFLRLRQAEWEQLLADFNAACESLEQEMQMPVEEVTEKVVSDWQRRVQALETQLVKPIRTRAQTNQDESVKTRLEDLKSLMHRRSTEANRYRWKERYLADADTLQQLIQSTTEAIDCFLQEQSQMEEAKIEFERLASLVETQVDRYDEICSSHRFLKLNKVTTVDACQKEVQGDWKQMQKRMTMAKQVVDQTAQWDTLFKRLNIQHTSDDNLDQEQDSLNQRLNQIQEAHASAQQLYEQAPPMTKIKENLYLFQQAYEPVHQALLEAQNVLNERQETAQKESDLEACESLVSAVEESVQEHVEEWKQDLKTIENSKMQVKHRELERHSTQVIYPILTRLQDKFLVNIKAWQDRLDHALGELAAEIVTETSIHDLVKRSKGHAKSAADISSWISHCQNAIEQIDPHDESAQEDMEALQQKMVVFEPVMSSFEDMTVNIQALKAASSVQEIWDGLVSEVNKRAQEIKKQWETMAQVREQTDQDVQKTTQGMTMMRKIKNVMNLLGEMRDCLDSIQVPAASDIKSGQEDALAGLLRQPQIESYLRMLSSTEQEMKSHLEGEMKELDAMAAHCHDALTHQYQETKDAVSRLTEALREKEAELNRALELGQFLAVTDDLNILQSSLEEAIGKLVVTLMGHSMSRSDLQAKVIELDARYKYYENNILKSLQTAKEIQMIHHPEKRLAAQQIRSADRRWELLKKQYKTRKVELGRTIDSKEFQQKQTRDRKTSLPNRRPSPLLRVSDTSRLLPTPSASSSASTRLSIGRHQQPSKSATHVKTLPRLTKPPLNSYVADPANDLDIEIGRIVNNTPYRVKVKMVPGEVGRYWFGDRNPKMAYCRVLKSKMVMVRVGGGWTELSQFLRDHALLEGDFIPKLADTILEEEPAIQEGFIETRRANPLGSTQPTGTPSHSASTSGYKQGDKFITTDENGNQLQVKMRRFSGEGNDYTRRRMARKKEKLIKENADPLNNTQK